MSKNTWKTIALPLIFLAVFVSLFFISKLLNLPPESELIEVARTYFDEYGLAIVLVSSIIEGLLLVGWYYPGSLVIFLGVIFAGQDVAQVVTVLAVIALGLLTAHTINFFLGKYGWYRLLLAFGLKEPLENAQRRLTKYGLVGILMSYWQPNLAALTSTAAGVIHFSFRKFFLYSLIAIISWNIFWGTIVFFLGEAALNLIGVKFVIAGITVWLVYLLVSRKWNKKKTAAETNTIS